MEKWYKEFYKIGNNKYYTIRADDELFIATSTFIKVARRFKFLKDEITQGLKLLKLTTPIMVLFDKMTQIKLLKEQKETPEELLKYENFDPEEVKQTIETAYNLVTLEQEQKLQEWLDLMKEETRLKISVDGKYDEKEFKEKMIVFENRYESSLKTVKKHNPLNNGEVDIKTPKGVKIINGMLNSGIEHLYTELVTGFMKNVYMYRVDMFGKITIYRVITVKDVVQTIDTFIYDQKIIKKLMKHLEEKDKSNRKGR